MAIFLGLSFLYSPAVEKQGPVYITKTLVIAQERNTPAYTVFQQAQKINNNKDLRQISSVKAPVEILSLNQVDPVKIVARPDALTLSEMSFSKTELQQSTEKQLSSLAMNQQDSALLNKLNQSETKNTKQTVNGAASIQGFFELKGGVGIVNHTVSVKRVQEGQEIEIGRVDLKAGMYQIYVNSFDGELVAEVKDDSGIIIGEDRKRISGLKRVENYFTGPSLTLGRPNAFSLNLTQPEGEVFKNESNIQASFFSGNYNLKKTTDIYPNVARHSSTIALVESQSQKFARTLSIKTVKEKAATVLFTSGWVDGVIQYLSDKIQIQYMQQSGVIIGRVIQDGKPVQGAQVVIDSQSGVEPYYFNQLMIPELHQSTTGANGYFIILGALPGSYQISAFQQNRLLGTQTYFVEEKLVSFQEIQTTSNIRLTTVRSFDAFTGKQIKTDVFIPGLEDVIETDQEANSYRSGSDEGIIEVLNRPQSNLYIPYVYVQNQNKDYIHLPQISEQFVNYIIQQKRLNVSAENAVFIGFVQMNKFKVHLANEQMDEENIIYFDSNGNIFESPVPNGGFIILNMPKGIQEVILQDEETDRTSSQVFYVKSGTNYLSHFTD